MKLFNDRLQSWFISNWKYGPSHDADNIEQNGGVAGLSSLKVFVYKCKARQQKEDIVLSNENRTKTDLGRRNMKVNFMSQKWGRSK